MERSTVVIHRKGRNPLTGLNPLQPGRKLEGNTLEERLSQSPYGAQSLATVPP